MQSKTERPLFSILVPSYNRPGEIIKNIQSVLGAGVEEIEIIISDDCSPLKKEIGEALQPFLVDERVKFYQQDKNLKEPGNKNFLVSKATGEFNIFLGDDDEFCVNALQDLKKYIEKNPGFDIYGFGYNIVDERKRLIRSHCAKKSIVLDNKEDDVEIFHGDILPLWVFHPATFCCRRGVESELGYQVDVGMAEDLWFIFESILKGKKLTVVPAIIFNWCKVQKVGSTTQSNQSTEYLANFIARKALYKKLLVNKELMSSGVYDYLSSREYRERFLYDAAISDKSITSIIDLDIDEPLKAELVTYVGNKSTSYLRRLNYLKRAYFFMEYIGLVDGAVIILRSFFQRMRYKTSHTFQ